MASLQLHIQRANSVSKQCCLTLRSSRHPTAWRAVQSGLGLRPILPGLAVAPRRWVQLSSNVRHQKTYNRLPRREPTTLLTMLTVLSHVKLKRAISAERGNVQAFLERLLIEVTSENYRYFLSEHLSYRGSIDQDANVHCWPPLLANERQVTGLFAIGLSRVCPVSIPEYPIQRTSVPRDEEDAEAKVKGGRIDYLAFYGNRHIALELKRCPISTIGNARENKGLKHQWEMVSKQAKEALGHMRAQQDFDSPVSVGLLVIRLSRKVTTRRDAEEARKNAVVSLGNVVQDVKKLTSADFLAYYLPPAEMQISGGWGKSEDQYRVFPGVVFAAVVHGNATRTAATDA